VRLFQGTPEENAQPQLDPAANIALET